MSFKSFKLTAIFVEPTNWKLLLYVRQFLVRFQYFDEIYIRPSWASCERALHRVCMTTALWPAVWMEPIWICIGRVLYGILFMSRKFLAATEMQHDFCESEEGDTWLMASSLNGFAQTGPCDGWRPFWFPQSSCWFAGPKCVAPMNVMFSPVVVLTKLRAAKEQSHLLRPTYCFAYEALTLRCLWWAKSRCQVDASAAAQQRHYPHRQQ